MEESLSPPVHISHDVPDLLGLLPVLFGFRPVESVVVVSAHGPRRRFGFRARLDLPPPELVPQAAHLLSGHLRRQDPDSVLAVVVSDDEQTSSAMLDALVDELGEHLVALAVRATATHYWVDHPDGPGSPVPYDASVVSPAVALAVMAGEQVLADRDELARRFTPVSGEREAQMVEVTEQVLQRLAGVVTDVGSGRVDPVPIARGEITAVLAKAERDERSLTDEEVALLSVWVSSIEVRDDVWGTFTRQNAHDALRVWTRVSQDVVPPFEPAVLCLAAFAAWLHGDGAQALIAVERALDADPDYSMAQLVMQLLDGGVPPDAWAAVAGRSARDEGAGRA